MRIGRALRWAAASLLAVAAGCSADAGRAQFPDIDQTGLTAFQRRVLTITRSEWQSPKPGTAYASGVTEQWCADFVSWVMREAGSPLRNPHSGGWRIPGVYSLQTSYQQAGRWAPAGSGHVPAVGDVLIHGKGSPFGEHTNIVIGYADGQVWTVGGNEGDGIRVSRHTLAELTGLLGYGLPPGPGGSGKA